MGEEVKKYQQNLPKIEELYADQEMTIKQSELNVLLNHPPNKVWISKHPFLKKEIINEEGQNVKVPYEYIPIERLQWLMLRIFGSYRREIKDVRLIANSVCVTVRIYYRDVITGQQMFQDGVGAVPLQTDRDAGAINFDKIKSNAVMLAAPAAATYAEKDAIGMVGKLFGRDLGRDEHEITYVSMRESFDRLEIEKLRLELSDKINNCTDEELKVKILDEITTAENEDTYTKEKIQSWMQQLSQ